MSRLRFAVIGCGAISLESHLPAILKAPMTELVAVVDTDINWAHSIAKKFYTGFAFIDYKELVGKVDAAIVATPNITHADISCYLLENGIHVLCEKPAATNPIDAGRMFSTAEKTPARLMIGQSRRFSSQIQFLYKLLERGYLDRIGELWASLGGVVSNWPARTNYRLQRNLSGGGPLMDQGVHLIDMALWLFDDQPVKIDYYETRPNDSEIEDNAELTIEFKGGGCAHLAMSYSHGLNRALTYKAQDGWVSTDIEKSSLEFFLKDSRLCRIAGVQKPILLSSDLAFQTQLEHFCNAILTQKPFIVKSDQIIQGLGLIEACYKTQGPFTWEAA